MSSAAREAFAIVRFPITLVAMAATVVFGWILTGHDLVALALTVGLDWFVINLTNRVTDLTEDLANHIPGTERVARRRGVVVALAFGVLAALVVGTAWIAPALLPYRLAVQAIGLAYNFRLVPTPRGLRRLKEIYFLKNFGSSCIFALTTFAYPLALAGPSRVAPAALAILVGFFIPFEMTFEILYDLRDHAGDRAGGIPTFPVVHGPAGARRIVDALLVGSSVVLAVGFGLGMIGLRELLMIVAPAAQLAAYRPRFARGLTPRDCIVLTHLASAELGLFLVGTHVWQALGGPANVFVR